ncbi:MULTISPECIES: carbohydrate ABC transporter permease [Paracoccus]|jgi:alpha-glucoside transport system permease protein|uniref:Sugar ABC transporter permease n=1 Tax=Paracoccus haeundaensis TaxID=225362 RepID=A0A5C4R3U7_9RHOB|nr:MULTISPECIES: sugar ABC transporter permease [Paracoccus]AZY92660.1 sugar ABC transporter permease [Paracoccus sp. Arc7-R13]KIX17535.1 alpha-glucoside ABC transporter permease [Paracoccus sp. 228]QXI65303.1 Lactose transport system permease protein LacF [Paracoccus marcusii]TNC01311.1 sugar ABC transporter permease [Paracoccus marcusii]TNH38431.1 sugar ABC transporter permease [Paracoccus haeundaensis]|tara:strand:- start:13212 stop:14207 length:996 start_codon:yes stop_codon:yes gene_type:complete
MELLWLAVSTIAIGVFGCVAWFWGSNWLLDRIYPPRGAQAGDNIRRANQIRPWLFLGPAILFLTTYLVYPVLDSFWRSLFNSNGSQFVGLDNYVWLVNDGKFRESMLNNMAWLLVVPALSTLFGLLAAQLTDRLKWGNIGKSLIFMPMAISFVGAGVIWKFIYEYRASGETQIGLLNWIVTQLGGEPQIWLTLPVWNNLLLMIVLVWIQTGFAMVILSAALRGIPEETIEAAILDGASPLQVFFKIKVPQIMGTIAVVWTTITIVVLKVFDIVFVMTNGQWGTQVLANLMYDWMFRGTPDYGRGSAIAIVLMILVTPIMVWNIYNARKEVR